MDSCARETERFAVTTATGALGPVLKKLSALLGDEYKLQEGTRQDIVSIKFDLGSVLWDLDDDAACKDWMMEARELSYHMEDGIDGFALGLESMGDGRFIQRADTVSPFKEFVERVADVSKRWSKMHKVGVDTTCSRSKQTTDPRALFLHKDASELVGMEEKKAELIKLLQENEMVCIHGPGGMGKTTLADLVYHAVGGKFQCRAFVSVHPSPNNMTEILGAILSQVTDGAIVSARSGNQQNNVFEMSGTEPAAEQINDFIKAISTFLSNKRYLVIIDDIWHWEDWEVIRKALPMNHPPYRIIITTRINSIAWKFRTEQGAGVYRQYFGREDAERLSAVRLMSKSVEGTNVTVLSTKIADMCDGPPFDLCPLAVICLSSALAESNHVRGNNGEWDTWARDELEDGFLMSTPSLKPLVQSLCLGFDHLPAQLRTCLLFCTVYPLGYWIDRGCLVRKWIAEGFVSQVEIAYSYLDKLVSMNLLQRDMGLYALHPIMRAFLMCKAKQDNFIAYSNGPRKSSHAKLQIRCSHLSLSSTGRYSDEVVFSNTRSLVVCGKQAKLDGVPFKALKKLRMLEIKSSSLENGDLVDICGLTWLKYLDLDSCNRITELPREIGRLQNLVGLCVTCTRISKLPAEIEKLQNLETLDVSCTEVAELPTWIEKLPSLKTLNVSDTRVTELPTWIEKLQSLKTLNVSGTRVTDLPTSIQKLQSLKTLNVSGTRVAELPTWIQKLQCLKTLNVSGSSVMELPREIIKNLVRLENLDISSTRVIELPKEIWKLQHLRTLDIRDTKLSELSCSKDLNSLSVVAGTDRYPGTVVKFPLGVIISRADEEVISSSEAKYREYLSILVLFNHFGDRCEVLPVRMLRVAGRYMKVPQWVKQDLCNVCSLDIRLCKLEEQDLEFLKTKMPNLRALQLRLEVLPREPVAITRGGFWKLETFYVDCRLPRVITFKEAAMPKLKHLEFKFYTGIASQDYSMGIKHLPKLENLVFRCSEYYTSDCPVISTTIEAMRKEAAEHPNCITLYVNDKKPEVFRSGAKWISHADRAIMQKESEERECIEKQRKQVYDAAKRRAEQYKKKNNATGGTADVEVGGVGRIRLTAHTPPYLAD